jgi:asparagine synthase (glutamine-hydrolysing)
VGSRLERLSAYATEANVRLTLPNDFLFKVDAASMRESLEVRVPMLDEELFAFGLTLGHHLKVNGRECKRVLRMVAERKLPASVARKAKWGFGVPLTSWLDLDFKVRLKDTLLGPTSRLPEFFKPEVYGPMVKAFCENRSWENLSQDHLALRMLALLSIHVSAAAIPASSE